ncbi:MAG: class I SAM-dependent methyltransferase [Caldimonas sp.]
MALSFPFRRVPSLADLSRRLRKVDQVFSVGKIRAEGLGADQVIAYYEECSPAYRKHHSREGAMHLAISPEGRFDAKGFYGQLGRIAAAWPARPPHDVLELGFGQGFNLAHLAARFPEVRFTGIDLTPTHSGLTRKRLEALGLNNVTLTQGDFHVLPYADRSFDHVYAIEAFCYARDLQKAMAEVARVLRPGGTFTLFDGYLGRRPETFSAEEALAAELVAKGVALESFQLVDDIVDAARRVGLESRGVTSFDAAIAPNLRKLERLTGAVIRFPWLGRRALARRSPMRGRNVLTGYLMYSTVFLGLTVYREIVLHKAGQ